MLFQMLSSAMAQNSLETFGSQPVSATAGLRRVVHQDARSCIADSLVWDTRLASEFSLNDSEPRAKKSHIDNRTYMSKEKDKKTGMIFMS